MRIKLSNCESRKKYVRKTIRIITSLALNFQGISGTMRLNDRAHLKLLTKKNLAAFIVIVLIFQFEFNMAIYQAAQSESIYFEK